MLGLLASLTVSMDVRDEAFKAGMATARAEARKTGQDLERSGGRMAGAIDRAAHEVNAAAIRMVDSLAEIGREVRNTGIALTAGLTVPLGALAIGSKRTASDFQTAMNRVKAAMLQADPRQIERLRDAALDLGPRFGRSAIETANAIEALAKNGMEASAILGGGLTSALTLAVVGQTDLETAAAATTDILAQFNLGVSDLPKIVDKVTGALDQSKMAMNDYRLAIGQAGGVAGGLGYTFDDLNVALAATASSFDSGSDAGTSFRAFLNMLTPGSKDAARVIDELGVQFYTAAGEARPLAEIAGELNRKFGNLSDKALQSSFKDVFGIDAMRTAIALTRLGTEGVERYAAAIEEVTAAQKVATLLDGEAAAAARLAGSWERLRIAIGEAGIIQALTLAKDAAASLLDVLAKLPPQFFWVMNAAGLMAASIGPLILGLTTLGKFALPFLLLRLGPIATAFGALLNPVGMVIRLLGQLALRAGTATVIGRLGVAAIGAAGPLGLLASAIAILGPQMYGARVASADLLAANERLGAAQDEGAEIAKRLANSTGVARDRAMEAARAFRVQAVAAQQAARQAVILARANLAASQRRFANVPGTGAVRALASLIWDDPNQARANLQQAQANARLADANLRDIMQAMAAPAPPPAVNLDLGSGSGSKSKPGGKSAADAARERARAEAEFADAIGQARVQFLEAYAETFGGFRAREAAAMAAIDEERAALVRSLKLDEDMSEAQRAQLLAAKDQVFAQRRTVAAQERAFAEEQHSAAIIRAANEARETALRHEIDMAGSAKERRAGELRLLDLQYQQEKAEIALLLATTRSGEAEYQQALDRERGLDRLYADRREAVSRRTEDPAGTFLRNLNAPAAAIDEQVQEGAISALRGLNSEIADAILGAANLGQAFANMGKRIIQSLMEIAIQQAVIRPLANSLFGTADAGGNRSGGLLSGLGSLFRSATPAPGGARATGGPIRADRWYTVGERGPERFYPGVSGTVIPNDGRGDRAPSEIMLRVVGEEGRFFRPVIRAEARGQSVRVVGEAARRQAMAGGQRY